MPTVQSPRQQQPRPRQRSGGGWLVIALLAGGALAAAIFMADDLRSQFGLPDEPAHLGSAPTVAADADGQTSQRDADLAARQLDGVQVAVIDQQPSAAVAVTETTPAAPVTAADTSAAARRGEELLAQADRAYRTFDWDQARDYALQVEQLDLPRQLRQRANDIINGADALEEMFTKLNTKDELVRGWETHPLLVNVTSRGNDNLVVPLANFDEQDVATTEDPVAWIEHQLSTTGKVALMATNGVSYTLERGAVAGVQLADHAGIRAAKQTEFDKRLQKAQQGDFANDPLLWYEAAKFAYRHRLDDQVTAMLDRALALNPFLATALREDKAQGIYFKLTKAMEQDKTTSAAVWLNMLEKDYQDTTAYPLARAYYDGNMQSIADARRDALAKRRVEAERIQQARVERVAALEGDQAAERIATEEPPQVAGIYEPEPAVPLTGDVAEAQQAFDDGMAIYNKAINMGVTDERDRLYTEAQGHFDKALRLFEQLGMTDKAILSNRQRYACLKYRRTF